MTRTHDLLITNQLLYRLSYISIFTFGVADLILTNQLLYQLSHSSIKTNLNFQKQIASASDKVNHIIISMQRQHLFPPMLYTRLRVYYGSYFCRITCIF